MKLIAMISPALLVALWAPTAASAQALAVQQLKLEALPVDVDLAAVSWAFETEAGRIVFADPQAKLVYIRETTGATRVFGAQGEGPGEYRDPVGGFLHADSVIIHEVGLGRRNAISLRTGMGESRRFDGHPVGRKCQ